MKKLTAILLLAALCAALRLPAFAETETPPQFSTTKSFIAELEENDLAYAFHGVDKDGDERVTMNNKDENFAYTINIYFDENEEQATVFIWNIIAFEDADFVNVLRAVNNLNCSYKYIRFYVDESDNTVTCAMNLILHDEDDAGDIVLEGLLRAASILQKAYPQLAPYKR